MCGKYLAVGIACVGTGQSPVLGGAEPRPYTLPGNAG